MSFMSRLMVSQSKAKGEQFDHSAFLDDYIMGDEIGEGGFGKVFKATHKVTGENVAVKYMNISEYLQ